MLPLFFAGCRCLALTRVPAMSSCILLGLHMNLAMLVLPMAFWRGLRIVVGLTLAFCLIRQVRKPSRWVGRPFLWMMNKSHSDLTDWGLHHVQVRKDFTVLDVGCGGGRTIQKLAAMTNRKVYGADYAAGSVAESNANNAALVQTGRVAVVRASVSSLPFSDSMFDLVTAVETQYYWPDLVNDMKEIRRVLKPGGTLLVIAEEYKHGGNAKAHDAVVKLLGKGCMGVTEHRELCATAGYTDVEIFKERERGWICVTARKAEA
jgi:SAM-dependent methyltransferase